MTFAKNQEITKPVSEAKLHISRSERKQEMHREGAGQALAADGPRRNQVARAMLQAQGQTASEGLPMSFTSMTEDIHHGQDPHYTGLEIRNYPKGTPA